MFERFGIFRQKTADITLEDIPALLERDFGGEEREIESKILNHVNDIKKTSMELRGIAAGLRSIVSPDKYSNSIKDKFCDKLIENIDTLISSGSGSGTMLELSESIVKSASGMNIKEFRHLAKFREDMSKIAEKVKVIGEKIRHAEKIGRNSRLSTVTAIKSHVNSIKDYENDIKKIDGDIENLKSSAVSMNEKLESEKNNAKELNAVLESYRPEKMRIAGLGKSLGGIQQKISDEFAGLERPIKKFMYYGDLTKDDQNLLKNFVSDPSSCFIASDHSAIKRMLECMSNYRSRNVIDLDERKLSKLHDVLRHFEFLVDMKEQHIALMEGMKREELVLNEKTGPVRNSLKASSMRIAAMEKDIESGANMINEKAKERNFIEGKIRQDKEKIRVLLASVVDYNINLV